MFTTPRWLAGSVTSSCSATTVVSWHAFGQCSVPDLPAGVTYTHVAAGGCHSMLLRSDGGVVAFGSNHGGQCAIHSVKKGEGYIPAGWAPPVLPLQLVLDGFSQDPVIVCRDLGTGAALAT